MIGTPSGDCQRRIQNIGALGVRVVGYPELPLGPDVSLVVLAQIRGARVAWSRGALAALRFSTPLAPEQVTETVQPTGAAQTIPGRRTSARTVHSFTGPR